MFLKKKSRELDKDNGQVLCVSVRVSGGGVGLWGTNDYMRVN
jgi:hypothetical protein